MRNGVPVEKITVLIRHDRIVAPTVDTTDSSNDQQSSSAANRLSLTVSSRRARGLTFGLVGSVLGAKEFTSPSHDPQLRGATVDPAGLPL